MDKIRIQGPATLTGRVRISGAKNAVLPEMAAFLMLEGAPTLRNVPAVRDVTTMLKVLQHLGIRGATLEDGVLRAERSEPAEPEAPYGLVRTMRASILVLGPLLARLGRAKVSLPGGCAIGARPVDLHIDALRRMGATIGVEHGYVVAACKRLRGAAIRFHQKTVTGTENILMAATLAEGRTVLENCALEPEIPDLARFLNACGARIEGAGTDTIVIDGVPRLTAAEHTVIPDRIEAGTFLIAAAATGSSIVLDGAEPDHLEAVIDALRACGVTVETEAGAANAPAASGPATANGAAASAPAARGLAVRCDGPLKAADLETQPYPDFPTDLQAQYMAMMTAAKGTAQITETVFENRFMHVAELLRMGARITVRGQTASVEGPTDLSGAPVMASDLRASASLIVAGLRASGETVIDRAYHIDRGYERVETKFQGLGARIERVR